MKYMEVEEYIAWLELSKEARPQTRNQKEKKLGTLVPYYH